MNKKILLTSIVSVLSVITLAYADSIMTSKGYVDTQIDTTQVKIPASNPNNATLGDTVMTYTAAGNGTIGERGIYNDASSYTAAEDEDKLITASALKGAFDALPTTTTTKLTCANSPTCDLWTITPQTAYGNAASGGNGGSGNVGLDLNALIGATEAIDTGVISHDGWGIHNDTTYGLTTNGTFAVDYDDKGVIRGTAQCSSQYAEGDYYDPTMMTTTTLPDSTGVHCWCKLDSYTPSGDQSQSLSGPWVYYAMLDGDNYDPNYCANTCAGSCVYLLQEDSDWRSMIFSVTH